MIAAGITGYFRRAAYAGLVIRHRASPAIIQAFLAAALAILLAIRLLSPAGFMPSFEHGAITIVACPDADPPMVPMAHHHQGSKKTHQQCPYAAAAGAITFGDLPIFAAILVAGASLLLGRAFRFLERHRRRERPPLRGPPLLA